MCIRDSIYSIPENRNVCLPHILALLLFYQGYRLSLIHIWKRLNRAFLYRRSDRIRRELEQKYGLHPAERKKQRLDKPLRKVAASAGDVKKQVGNTGKALNGQYRFQTMGEYRALLSLYNMTVEEA